MPTRYTKAMKAVDSQLKIGYWEILRLSSVSRSHVVARCNACNKEQNVDIHELTRQRKRLLGGKSSCQACANKMKRGTFARLPQGQSLLNTFEHEYRKASKDRGLEYNLTTEQFRALVFSNCTYCGSPPTQRRSSNWDEIYVNGIDRIDNNCRYDIDSCVTCCKRCNYMKYIMDQDEFLKHIYDIASHIGMDITNPLGTE